MIKLLAAEQAMPAVALQVGLQHRRLRETVAVHQMNAHAVGHRLAEAAVTRLGDQAPAVAHQLQRPHCRIEAAAVRQGSQLGVVTDEHMLRPKGRQLGIKPVTKAAEADQHAPVSRVGQAQLARQLLAIQAWLAGSEPDPAAGDAPVHRQSQRTVQQQGAAAVEIAAVLHPGPEGFAERGVDHIPAEAGQPDQRCIEPLRQQRRRRWHIGQHQHRFWLLSQPGLLRGQLLRQALLQLVQRQQGGGGVRAEGISLQHTHIPLAAAVLHGQRPEGRGEKGFRQSRGEHQPPVGPQPVQLAEHSGGAGAVSETMAADAGVDQHGVEQGVGSAAEAGAVNNRSS